MVISRRFIQHAREELGRDNRLQASEKTWGAMAQALKAIAQVRGWRHQGHDNVVNVGRHIGKEYNYPDIIVATYDAESLHRNFYENNDRFEVIENTINLIEDILPELEALRFAPPRPYTITHRDDRDRLRQLTGDRNLQVGDTSPVGFSLRHPPDSAIGDDQGTSPAESPQPGGQPPNGGNGAVRP